MAGRSWRDLQPAAQTHGDAHGTAAPRPPESLEEAAALNPRLGRLLSQRRRLQSEMETLTGADAPDPRYPVEPLAARRRAHAAWERRREDARTTANAAADGVRERSNRTGSDAASVARSAADRFLRRPVGAADRLRSALDERLRDAPVDRGALGRVGRAAGGVAAGLERAKAETRSLSTQLDEGRARIAREGSADDLAAFDRDTAALRGGLDKADRLLGGPAAASKAIRSRLDGPRETMEAFADRGRARVLDPLSEGRGYAARAARLLSVETGGVAALADRREALRARFLERRRERRAEEERDERRRARALERRRERRDQEGGR
ncbi:MAG: hypothetical protein RIB45_18020 [Marivibrio sp.]|uniref:hypothetical protein n=1 Tax=Marivibrio sp. TaxID=2039719 RepID=UPI0032F066FE